MKKILITLTLFISALSYAKTKSISQIDGCPKGTTSSYLCLSNPQPGDDVDAAGKGLFEKVQICTAGKNDIMTLVKHTSNEVAVVENVKRYSKAGSLVFSAEVDGINIDLSIVTNLSQKTQAAKVRMQAGSVKFQSSMACSLILSK